MRRVRQVLQQANSSSRRWRLHYKNVARLWAYETSVVLNKEISNDIPFNDFYQQYEANDYKLHLEANSRMENKNTLEGLDRVLVSIGI